MLEKNIVEDAKNFGVCVVPSRDPSPYLRILRERRVEAGQRNRDGHFREPPASALIPGVQALSRQRSPTSPSNKPGRGLVRGYLSFEHHDVKGS